MTDTAPNRRYVNAVSVAGAVLYRVRLSAFVVFLALTLLTLVDIRRGFLFADYQTRTLFYVFTPWHLLMLAGALSAMGLCYRGLKRDEADVPDAARLVKPLSFIILAILIVDLFAYRGVPAARSMASGRINLDWMNAFGVTAWWRPFALATSYLLNVWHATMLGILISGLALTALPIYLGPYFAHRGFSGSLLGALFALPQPFCSCCSSVMAPSFVRRGASNNFLLSFIVGAPMLNITTIVLALAFLPAPFAITRIVAGIVVAVFVTYVVVRIVNRWDGATVVSAAPPRDGWLQKLAGAYLRLFDVDRLIGRGSTETPSQLIGAWLYASSRIALVLVPTLWIWSAVASAIFELLPAAFGNNLPSVVIAAVGGTFLMISTWSEIPIALQLIQSGMTGPAAALLVVLPAVSLPCMMLLGGSLQRFRTVAVLSAAVMLVGIVTGAMFL
jgi:uncharacterized protein